MAIPSERSVVEWGVVPDSSSTQTGTIQAAIDSASGGGFVLYFPPGVYLTGPLSCGSDFTMRGENAEVSIIRMADDAIGDGEYKAVLTNENILPSDVPSGSGDRNTRINISDITFDGNRVNQTSTSSEAECLSFYGVDYATVRRVRCINAVSDGYDIDYCNNVHASDLFVENCGKTGVHFSIGSPQGVNEGNDNCSLRRATVLNCVASGVTDYLTGDKGNDNVFEDLFIKGCHDEGALFRGGLVIGSNRATVRRVTVIESEMDHAGSAMSGVHVLGDNGVYDDINVQTVNSSGIAGEFAGVYIAGDNNVVNVKSIRNIKATSSNGWGVLVEGDGNEINVSRIRSTNNNGVRIRGTATGNSLKLDGFSDIGSHGVSFRDSADSNMVSGVIRTGNDGVGIVSGDNNVISGLKVLELGGDTNHAVTIASGVSGTVVTSCDFSAVALGVEDLGTSTTTGNNV